MSYWCDDAALDREQRWRDAEQYRARLWIEEQQQRDEDARAALTDTTRKE